MEKPERTVVLNIQIQADSWKDAIEAANDAAICLRRQLALTVLTCETHSYDYQMNARSNYTASVGDDYHKQLQGYLEKMKSPRGD